MLTITVKTNLKVETFLKDLKYIRTQNFFCRCMKMRVFLGYLLFKEKGGEKFSNQIF